MGWQSDRGNSVLSELGVKGKVKGAGMGGAKVNGRGGFKGQAAPRGKTRLHTPRTAPAPLDPVVAVPRLGWREAISSTVSGLGFDLVDVERAQRGLLRVTIDRQPGRAYTVPGEFVIVEDCEQVTRQLQYALEVEGLEYARLEVSSPGLDRPLKTEADFQRFTGVAISVTLKVPFQGRKVWQGVLSCSEVGSEGGSGWNLLVKTGKVEQELGFKFEEVREARLVPVVDFKGRKANEAGPADATAGDVPGSDGG
jgi:ribosome maturation factor RimP